MTTGEAMRRLAGTVLAGVLASAPALADVKAGVDAWSRGDYARAVAEWRAPALAGDPDAEFNLGQAYKLGRGVPTDLAQATDWYRKAALQGHAQAQDNFGLALFQADHKAEALPWLEKSVARDERRTELVLGTMLFNGDAVGKDWVRAYALVSRASEQGLDQAGATLAQMDGYLTPEQRLRGKTLASRIAQDGRAARLATASGARPAASPAATMAAVPPDQHGPAAGTVARVDVPPARAPSPPREAPLVAQVTPRPAPQPSPRPAPPAPAHTAPHPPAATGRWRVQLGAFRDAGNARALWASVGARVGGRPAYVAGGGVTRLQAGPFASRADAERACHAAGGACRVLS